MVVPTDTPAILLRKDAKALGLKRYFTGNPCPHGHVAERLVSNGLCARCLSIRAVIQMRKQRAAMPAAELRAIRAKESRDWRKRNPEKAHLYDQARSKHPSHKAAIARWREKNRGHIREYDRARQQRLLVDNIQYRLRLSLRTRLNIALKRRSKTGSAVSDLGCSIEYFIEWIESKFSTGMSWENWGRSGWHLDHVRPLAEFDLTDRDQFLLACHYTNMRPLWASENVRRPRKTQIPSK